LRDDLRDLLESTIIGMAVGKDIAMHDLRKQAGEYLDTIGGFAALASSAGKTVAGKGLRQLVVQNGD
jgi:hypothetical protein